MLFLIGLPKVRCEEIPQCFVRPYKLICHHVYETNGPQMWLMDGVQVEHDGSQFDINETDRSITLLDVSWSRYANKETLFQCCVELTSGPQVCGEGCPFDPLGKHAILYFS